MKFLVLESACTDEVNGLNKPISYVSDAMLRHFIQKAQNFLAAHQLGIARQSLLVADANPFGTKREQGVFAQQPYACVPFPAYLCTLLQ